MKKYSLLCFIILLCVFNPKISMAEPSFFLQTLTNRFVDWVFGHIDNYIEDKPDKSEKTLDRKGIPKATNFIRLFLVSSFSLTRPIDIK